MACADDTLAQRLSIAFFTVIGLWLNGNRVSLAPWPGGADAAVLGIATVGGALGFSWRRLMRRLGSPD